MNLQKDGAGDDLVVPVRTGEYAGPRFMRWWAGAWWEGLTARIQRHRRVAIALAITGMGLAALAFVNRNANPEPTAATTQAMWRFQPMEGGPIISLSFDQNTGWTKVTDSQSPGKKLYVHGDRVLVPTDSPSLGLGRAGFLSAPIEEVFPVGLTFAPTQLAASLERRPKECTFPSQTEDDYVQFFLAAAVPQLNAPYTICGRSVFSKGSAGDLIYAEDLAIEGFSPPTVEDIVDTESLGTAGPVLLDQLMSEFSPPLNQAGS